MAVSNRVLNYIITGEDRLSPVMNKASANIKKTTSSWSKAFNAVGTASAIAFATGLGVSINKAMQVPLAQLKTTIKNAGASYDTWRPKIAATENAMAKLGFGMADVDQSAINLIRSTGNVGAALALQGTAADLARAKHISLSDASMQLARAADGNARAIKGLGVTMITGASNAAALKVAQQTLKDQLTNAGSMAQFAAQHHLSLQKAQQLVTLASQGSIGALNTLGFAVLPKTASQADKLSQIQAILNQRLGGSAAAAAKTFGGKLSVLKAEFGNVASRIGLALLPALSTMLGLFAKLASSPAAIYAVAAAVTAMTAAWVGAKIAATLFTGSARAALIGSGIGALIVGISAVVLLLITHWQTLKHWAEVAFHGIQVAASAVWNWLKSNWPYLLGVLTGPIGTATVLIVKNWDHIKSAASVAFTAVVGWFKGLPGRIVGAIGNVGSLLYQGGRNVITGLWNGVKAVWNDVIGWFKGLPGQILHALGIASPPQWALDAGKFIMQGILKTITHGAASVKNFFVGLAGDIAGPLKDVWAKIPKITITGPANSAMDYAKKALSYWGWGQDQWPALSALWQGESGWRWNAENPASGAYGIPQALPASKMAAAGADWRTNQATQINWGLSYIASAYGSPAAAYGAWLSRNPHWYGKGGWITEPILGVGRSGQLYGFGESGREYVSPAPAAAPAVYNVTVNVGAALASKAEIGKAVSEAVVYAQRHGAHTPFVLKTS